MMLRSSCSRGLDRGQPASAPYRARRLLLIAVRLVLGEISPQVVALLLVLDARENHLGAGDLGARVGDVFLEHRRIPGDARVLVGVAVAVALRRTGLAALE